MPGWKTLQFEIRINTYYWNIPMRDLLNSLDQLTEATLSASQIVKYPERFDAFIDHIKNGRPFYTEADGQEVTLKKSEAKRFLQLYDQGLFTGKIVATDIDGVQWPVSQFRKTAEFGGASSKPTDDENTELNKEGVMVKPSQIGICDHDIAAPNLVGEITGNSILQSTEYGRMVIQAATSIALHEPAVLPREIIQTESIKKAIVDYAGEYLGVLALVESEIDFPDLNEFLEWLDSDIGSLILNFPSKSNTPLADSFATISNGQGRQINISSKGTGGGAAPSLSSLTIPDSVRKKKAYKTAVDLIDLCQNPNLPQPRSVSQIFQVMNLLHERIPDSIPKEFRKFLPWDSSVINDVRDSMKQGKKMVKYRPLFATLNSQGEDGGKLTYVTKLAVMKIINSGEVPEFQAAVLEILDNNFIQIYTTVNNKTGILKFVAQWPAKLNGHVTIETKSGATDPTKGGFSFKLKPKGSSDSSEDFSQEVAASKKSTEKKIEKVATGHVSITPNGPAKKIVGPREKR